MRTLRTLTLMTFFLLAALGTARAQNVSVTPSSGAGGRTVTATAAGFDADNVGYNTGFYLENAFMARCPPATGAHANCSVTFQVPYGPPGKYTITAYNSISEFASTTFIVLPPKLTIQPTCGPPGSSVDIQGTNFPVDFDAQIFFGGSATAVHGLPDSSGNLSLTVEVPSVGPDGQHPVSDGRYRISAIANLGTNAGQTFTVGICNEVGRFTDVSGTVTISSGGRPPVPARVGDAVYMDDFISTGANGRGMVLFNDQTQIGLGNNSRVTIDDYVYDPSTNAGSASSGFLVGVFSYLSGLIKKEDPPNIQVHTDSGTIGIRGTEFIGQQDQDAGTVEIDLIHGIVDITPNQTVTTTTYTAPVKIVFDGSGSTSSPLTREEYDAIKARLFPTASLDTTPPVPDAVLLPDINEQCSTNLPEAPTATDAFDGRIVGVPDTTGPFGQGDNLITWTFTDAAGNHSTQTQAVRMHDTTAPAIALNGPGSMQIESCATFIDPGAIANDNCAGNLTSAIVVTGSVNTAAPGTYVLHYNVSDSNHNAAAEVTRMVKVVDTTAPEIVLNGVNPMTIELGSLFSDPAAIANDGCHPALPVTVSGSVNTNAVGTYVLTYDARDVTNNSSQVTRTVRVVDTTAPKVVAPPASSVYSDINCQGAVPNLLPQTVASDLGGTVTLIQSPAVGTLIGVGQRTITISGTDPSGNTRTVTTFLTVIAGPSFIVGVSPNSVKRGGTVTLTAGFNNCASTNQALTLQVSLTNPSSKTLVVSLPFTMKAGQKGSLAIPIPISKSTPTGTYFLTLDVYVAGVKIGTSTAQLMVTK